MRESNIGTGSYQVMGDGLMLQSDERTVYTDFQSVKSDVQISNSTC